jgi:hypothetical protein
VPRARYFLIAWACWLSCSAVASPASADAGQARDGAYDLRISIAPVAFQAALSQGWFGSAARIEYELARSLDIGLRGRVAWWPATGEHTTHSYATELMFALHVMDEYENQALSGTVYPEDTPAIQGVQPGTDQDMMGVPVSERMEGGRMSVGDYDASLTAAMRNVHCLRAGVGFLQVVERALPEAGRTAKNQLPYASLGYSFGTHWNLPRSTTGKREVGWRRLYFDALATTQAWTKASPDLTSDGRKLKFLGLGGRMGVEGTMAGLFDGEPGIGLSYQLELGAYPGKGGLEGYLFIALGVAIDAITR